MENDQNKKDSVIDFLENNNPTMEDYEDLWKNYKASLRTNTIKERLQLRIYVDIMKSQHMAKEATERFDKSSGRLAWIMIGVGILQVILIILQIIIIINSSS